MLELLPHFFIPFSLVHYYLPNYYYFTLFLQSKQWHTRRAGLADSWSPLKPRFLGKGSPHVGEEERRGKEYQR